MYKVFFNDHLLFFKSEIKNSLKNNIHQNVEIEGFSDFLTLLDNLEESKHVPAGAQNQEGYEV